MSNLSSKFLKSNYSRESSILNNRAADMVGKIEPFLVGKKSVLDIGSGTGHIANLLASNHKVTALDVMDISSFEEIKPVTYDGCNFPFEDKQFDVSILITMLHHTKNPERVIAEAKRVSREIIIVEDVYLNTIQKYLTYSMDSIVNFEFLNHPHTNKSSAEWEVLFNELNLDTIHFEEFSFWYFFKGAIFHLRDSL